MTITELVQEALQHNSKVVVFAARGTGKSYSARELRMRLSEDALVVDDAEIRRTDGEYEHLLDAAINCEVDIVLLGTPVGYYSSDTFDDTWTKLTITP